MARIWIEAWLSQLWPDGDAAQNAALVVSEVAGNAVLHGNGPVRLTASADDERLHCEISDQSPHQPKFRDADDDDEGGRGLLLVAALVIPGSWSVRLDHAGGKIVAFDISSREQNQPSTATVNHSRPGRAAASAHPFDNE